MSFFNTVYRRLKAIDLDEVFSYQTTKEVRMLDVRLGVVCWLIRAAVLTYVIGYVFWYKQGYSESEKGVGHVISTVTGRSYSLQADGRPLPWDDVDAVKPALENGAAFVATTIFVTKGQEIGNATNPSLPCTADSDCPSTPPLSHGKCSAKQCLEFGWQPPFSEADLKHTEVHQLVNADQFGVWLRGSIRFPSLDGARIFSTMDATAPTAYAGSDGARSEVTTATTTSSTVGAGGSGGAMPPDFYTVGQLLALVPGGAQRERGLVALARRLVALRQQRRLERRLLLRRGG